MVNNPIDRPVTPRGDFFSNPCNNKIVGAKNIDYVSKINLLS